MDFWPVSHIQPTQQMKRRRRRIVPSNVMRISSWGTGGQFKPDPAKEILRAAQPFYALCGRSCMAQQNPAVESFVQHEFLLLPGMLWDVEDTGVTPMVDWMRQRTQGHRKQSLHSSHLHYYPIWSTWHFSVEVLLRVQTFKTAQNVLTLSGWAITKFPPANIKCIQDWCY